MNWITTKSKIDYIIRELFILFLNYNFMLYVTENIILIARLKFTHLINWIITF